MEGKEVSLEGATAGAAPPAIDEEDKAADQAPPPPSLEFLEKKWSGMAKCKTLPNKKRAPRANTKSSPYHTS